MRVRDRCAIGGEQMVSISSESSVIQAGATTMYQRPCRWLAALLTLTAAGCGADRAELERVKAELAATRAELQALQANQPGAKPAYLDELERLSALEAKGALTKAEFEARKK